MKQLKLLCQNSSRQRGLCTRMKQCKLLQKRMHHDYKTYHLQCSNDVINEQSSAIEKTTNRLVHLYSCWCKHLHHTVVNKSISRNIICTQLVQWSLFCIFLCVVFSILHELFLIFCVLLSKITPKWMFWFGFVNKSHQWLNHCTCQHSTINL